MSADNIVRVQVTTHSDGTVQKTATMSDGSHDVIDDEASDDEVVDVSSLSGLSGARVRLQRPGHINDCLGSVRSVSPGGSRMLVCCDEDSEELWVGAGDSWYLDEGADKMGAAGATVMADMDAFESAPILENWKWNADGSLCGHVYGKPGFRAGELMTTSTVPQESRFETHVVSRATSQSMPLPFRPMQRLTLTLDGRAQVTESGSAYRLGQPAQVTMAAAACLPDGGGMRRSSRATGKESVLDAFAESEHAVSDATDQQLSYVVGGSDVGGAGAERILRGAFTSLDDNLITLRAQYSGARRVVLRKADTPVAAAVVEVHGDHAILEVPILAADRHSRQQGHGSLLVAILVELACRLRLRLLIVSSTQVLPTPMAACSPDPGPSSRSPPACWPYTGRPRRRPLNT